MIPGNAYIPTKLWRITLRSLLRGIVVILLMSNCTEVVHIDLNASDPQVVVEANLSEAGRAEVRLRWSVNFEDDNDFPDVEGASVYIEDEFGNRTQLTEIFPGQHLATQMNIRAEKSYRLLVYTGSTVISAEDRMPLAVGMDSLTIRPFRFPLEGIGERIDTMQVLEAVVWYSDPVEEKNYYRVLEFRNDTLVNISITNDQFNNGKSVAYSLVNFRNPLLPGDKLLVGFQSISREVYEYLFGFSGVNGGPMASSPSNPVTNLQGTELGYFSAHSVHRLNLVVPGLQPKE